MVWLSTITGVHITAFRKTCIEIAMMKYETHQWCACHRCRKNCLPYDFVPWNEAWSILGELLKCDVTEEHDKRAIRVSSEEKSSMAKQSRLKEAFSRCHHQMKRKCQNKYGGTQHNVAAGWLKARKCINSVVGSTELELMETMEVSRCMLCLARAWFKMTEAVELSQMAHWKFVKKITWTCSRRLKTHTISRTACQLLLCDMRRK